MTFVKLTASAGPCRCENYLRSFPPFAPRSLCSTRSGKHIRAAKDASLSSLYSTGDSRTRHLVLSETFRANPSLNPNTIILHAKVVHSVSVYADSFQKCQGVISIQAL